VIRISTKQLFLIFLVIVVLGVLLLLFRVIKIGAILTPYP